ncbi:MAG: hypothetical protein LUQ07_02595 [Methanospirillum sp.]|nr:hypothetical protein [Methanospirillum sp.]
MVSLQSQEKTAVILIILVILFCLGATCILDGMGKKRFSREYSQDLPDGTLVRYSGIIGSVIEVSGGHYLLEISGVNIFIPVSAGLPAETVSGMIPGAEVTVTGTVQHWKGKEEILVGNSADISLVSGYQGTGQHSGQNASEDPD